MTFLKDTCPKCGAEIKGEGEVDADSLWCCPVCRHTWPVLKPQAQCTVVHHPKTGAEVIYLHADCIELKVFGTCTRDAMEKLHSFVGGMLEHRDFS